MPAKSKRGTAALQRCLEMVQIVFEKRGLGPYRQPTVQISLAQPDGIGAPTFTHAFGLFRLLMGTNPGRHLDAALHN